MAFGRRDTVHDRTIECTKLTAPGVSIMQLLDQLAVASGVAEQMQTQGQLPLRYETRKDFHQEAIVPSAQAALHGDAILAGMLLEQR
jgi:hypothetical protein